MKDIDKDLQRAFAKTCFEEEMWEKVQIVIEAEIGEASGEETAGQLRSVAPLAMGKVAAGGSGWSGFGVRGPMA